MSDINREARLVSTFATLADALVTDYDVLDLLQQLVDTCVDLLEIDQAGILLVGNSGYLELAASTSESNRVVEAMQLAAEAGPCIESFETGTSVSVPDIRVHTARWPEFASIALEQGFFAVHAIPLRLRDTRIGALNLMRTSLGELGADDVLAAQAFADVATIGILQHRALSDSGRLNLQLQFALDSRIVIEQAKGVVANSHLISMDEAFALIRSYARSNHLSITEVASQLVDRRLKL